MPDDHRRPAGDTEDAPQPPVWCWDVSGHSQERNPPVMHTSVWADSWQAMTNEEQLKILSRFVANTKGPFPAGLEPDCLVRESLEPIDPATIPDLTKINESAIIVSGAMMDVLARFDLGETQILELPFYQAMDVRPEGARLPVFAPDRARSFPGRWGLLHLLARKAAFLPQASLDFRNTTRSRDEYTQWRRNYESGLVIALDSVKARLGADLWRDHHTPQFLYVSERLRAAMIAATLRTPLLYEAVRARLVQSVGRPE
jgi:hypothetical protein